MSPATSAAVEELPFFGTTGEPGTSVRFALIGVGAKLLAPNGKRRADAVIASAPPKLAEPPVVQAPAPTPAPAAVEESAAAAPAPAPPPAPPQPAAPDPPAADAGGSGGDALVANAMKYLGSRYVFGGSSSAGFDCSGFVYYVHGISGSPVGRGMSQQYNGGSHIAIGSLQPGDTVFFANTYMPGLSHDGIYIGNGQFIHANDERTGVTISSINTGYWTSHYAGATRLWG